MAAQTTSAPSRLLKLCFEFPAFFHLTNIDVPSCFFRQFFRPLYEDKGQKMAMFRSHLNPNQSCLRRERSREKKSKNKRLNASNNRRKRACIIFRTLGGEPVKLCYEPDIYGIQQIDSVDEETLLLFTSNTDKACLRDLFDSDCFMGKRKNKFMIFALHRISSIN